MSLAIFEKISELFGGGELSDEDKEALVQEALLMTLARATSADTNIKNVEIETVHDVILARTGVDVELADIRVAANSHLFESAPLEKYLHRVGRTVDLEDRVMIADALAEIIKADERISSLERNFFNMVAGELNLSPADLVGLAEETD